MEQVTIRPVIEDSWKAVLADEFEKPYFHEIKAFLQSERRAGYKFFPPGSMIFNAFNHTPYGEVKAVILGQDPYHGPGQAHGLCFSVPQGVRPPPSLMNIYKELSSDLGISPPGHGNLEKWAKSGVLLLNTVLTVREASAGSHRDKGWENFTDRVIDILSQDERPIAFVLWGRPAQAKAGRIDRTKNLVLTAAHPSPLSAHNGFFGCRHFSKINDYLVKNGRQPVDWSLT